MMQEVQTSATSVKITPTKPTPLVAIKPMWSSRQDLMKKSAFDTRGEPVTMAPVLAKKEAFSMEEHEKRERILSCPVVIPFYVEVPDGEVQKAVSFYKEAFGALEFCHPGHAFIPKLPYRCSHVSAELNLRGLQINICEKRDNLVKIDDNYIQGGHGLRTKDADEAIARAVRAGAVAVGEIADIYDMREGEIMDPYGFLWAFYSPAKNPTQKAVLEGFLDRKLDPTRSTFP